LGIIYRQAKMLLDAHHSGIPMDHLLMIGHQSLLLHPSELRAVRRVCPGALANYKWGEYADRFFKECLGVSHVNTLDYSSYEGADILHDLNQPVPANLKGRFDVVVEGGSLEHVFHFPIAIANLMQMTKVGGTIFASTVSNNLWVSHDKPATSRMPQWIRNLPLYSTFRTWLRGTSILHSFDNWLI